MAMREGTTTTTTMPMKEEKGLARKLASSVVAVIAAGLCLVLINYVVLITESIPDWGSETKDAMVELEQANMARLASDKAEHTGYVFGIVKDALQQLQGFAEQALPLAGSETMEVDRYLMSFPGLEQETPVTNHSVWYVPGLDPGTSPAVGSSLDGLLNRTALMDVLFRGMPREELMYLAALDDPSLIDDPESSVVLQAYPASDMLEEGLTTFNEDCDDRFDTGDNDFSLSYFDPRCRVWFQDARANSRNGEPVFTDPYASVGTGALTITPAAPVYATDGATLLGVVGIDMDFALIEASILGLRIMGDEGYAYLLTPTGGEVAAHPRLDVLDGIQNIVDLEPGVDKDDFRLVVERMTQECTGSASYQKSGETWLVSWEHETVSRSGADTATDSGGSSFSACSTGGFVVAVTVSEDTLLGAFSKTESEIRSIVIVASVVVVLLMTVTVCLTVGVARSVSTTLTRPVNQLVDIVKGLNNLDFSDQDPGVWMLNDINCPEVEELMDAFKSMTTIIHFGNQTLGSGDLDAAHKNYCDALFLFTKLNNDRGVSIVRNNLGNVCTLQARALVTRAKVEREQTKGGAARADALMRQADHKYEDAVTNFRLAIEDSKMTASVAKESRDSGSPHPFPAPSTTVPNDVAEQKEGGGGQKGIAPKPPLHDVDVVEAQQTTGSEPGDPDSTASLGQQLANRKFNLALCLAAQATDGGKTRNDKAVDEACELMEECEALVAERNDALGTDRQVEYLLALAALECTRPGRKKQTFEALERADKIITAAPSPPATAPVATTVTAAATAAAAATATPPGVLRQRLLVARGESMLATGEHQLAVEYWAEAIVGCGELMDVGAVTSSLVNLRGRVAYLQAGQGCQFSAGLVRSLGFSGEEGKEDTEGSSVSEVDLVEAIDLQVKKLGGGALLPTEVDADLRFVADCTGPVEVDLCFVMDCTGSMATWIDQTRQKLFDIIEQTKKEAENLKLRVAFVGYRDYGGRVKQYEGPYDFHSEEELPELEQKLRDIKAGGGSGYVADIAGGLKRATELSWRSPVRLCILFADAPCHGSIYHDFPDAYPKGCPEGVDPARMIYNLQELGADFYFIRICRGTDKMVDLLKEAVPAMAAKDAKEEGKEKAGGAGSATAAAKKRRKAKFVVHNLEAKENKFLDVVVNSVAVSAGLNLRVEGYS